MTKWPEGWTRGGSTSDEDPEATQAMPPVGRDTRLGRDRTGRADPEATQALPPMSGAGRDDESAQERTRVLPAAAGLGAVTPPAEPAPGARGAGGAAVTAPPAPPATTPQRRPRRSWPVRILRALVLLLVVLALLALGLLFWVDSRLNKVDALADYAGRPAATPGQDWLLVGSDSREGLSREQRARLRTGSAEGRRTDTMMLLHVPRSGGAPTLVAFPRDSYVEIPGRRPNKLNAAYALGGPQLLARTVEVNTGIRLDHYTEIGFDGFVGLVEAVGGVEMCPPRALKDRKAGLDIPAGCQQLDGAQALGYVRTRSVDARGDLGRIERQQEFLRAMFKESAKPSTLLNPVRSFRLINAGADALAVDRGTGPVDLVRFGLAMRAVAGDDAVVTTVPISDDDFRPGGIGSSVKWDEQGAERLFDLLRQDRPVPAADQG